MTRTLPTTTMTSTIARTIRVITFHRLDHSTPSYKAAHAVAFSSRILINSRGSRVRPCDPVEELQRISDTMTTVGDANPIERARHLEPSALTLKYNGTQNDYGHYDLCSFHRTPQSSRTILEIITEGFMTGRSIRSTVRLELEKSHACLPWSLNPRVRAKLPSCINLSNSLFAFFN